MKMDKEKIKQKLEDDYGYQHNGGLSVIIDVILDAIELSKQDDQVLIGQTLQVTTGNMVMCSNCDGQGFVVNGDNHYTCKQCNGAGVLVVADSGTASA
jgi:hypothetical protein